MSAPASLSRRDFARQVGASLTVVQRLVKRGVLPVDGSGKLRMPEALAAYVKVRTVKARAAQAAGGGAAGEPGAALPRSAPAHRHDDVIEVELERKRLGVRLQELRIGRESGDLLPRDDVRRDAQAVCSAIRAVLLALPSRVALLVEAIVASSDAQLRAGRIQRLLEDEVNLALEALHGAHLAAPAPAPAPAPPAKGEAA